MESNTLDQIAKACATTPSAIILREQLYANRDRISSLCTELSLGTSLSDSLFAEGFPVQELDGFGSFVVTTEGFTPDTRGRPVVVCRLAPLEPPPGKGVAQIAHAMHQLAAIPEPCWLRLNPEQSETTDPAFDACAPFSVLGVTRRDIDQSIANAPFEGVYGAWVDIVAPVNADAMLRLSTTLSAGFEAVLASVKRLHFGGIHHISRADYQKPKLATALKRLRDINHSLVISIDATAALLDGAVVFATRVLDSWRNGMDTLICDHAYFRTPRMKGLQLWYRNKKGDWAQAREAGFQYATARVCGFNPFPGGNAGDWSFDHLPEPGDLLVFSGWAPSYGGNTSCPLATWRTVGEVVSLIKSEPGVQNSPEPVSPTLPLPVNEPSSQVSELTPIPSTEQEIKP